MKRTNIGFFAATIAAICFSLTGTVIKYAYESGLSTIETLSLQSLLASCFLLGGLALGAPQHLRVSVKQAASLLCIGVIGSFGTSLFFATALNHLDASLGTLLLYTYPAWVAVGMRVFFQRKLSRVEMAALCIIFVGTSLTVELLEIGSGNTSIAPIGILLGAMAGLTYAFFNITSEGMLQNLSPWTVTAYAQFAASLTLIVTHPPRFLFDGSLSVYQWGLGLVLATLCSILPFSSFVTAIAHLGAQKAALVSTLEIPLALMFARLFLRETMNSMQILGACLIIMSIIWLRLNENKVATSEAIIEATTQA